MSEIRHNINAAQAALQDIRKEMAPMLRGVAKYSNTRITARAVGTYMKNADPSPRKPGEKGPLRVAKGRLARSLQGSFDAQGGREGIAKVSVKGAELRFEKGSKVPYAAIHEFGGTTHPRVTDKSRKFFWHMFFETGEEKWKRMALTKKSRFNVKIPARPYLEPSLKDEEPNIRRESEKRLNRLIISSLEARI